MEILVDFMQQVLGLRCPLAILAVEPLLERNKPLIAVCFSRQPLVSVPPGIAEALICLLGIILLGMGVDHLGQMLARRISTRSQCRPDMGMTGEEFHPLDHR